jgi:hypothetical protein
LACPKSALFAFFVGRIYAEGLCSLYCFTFFQFLKKIRALSETTVQLVFGPLWIRLILLFLNQMHRYLQRFDAFLFKTERKPATHLISLVYPSEMTLQAAQSESKSGTDAMASFLFDWLRPIHFKTVCTIELSRIRR